MSFYLSLFIFIISLICGLTLMIAAKDMRREKFLLLTSVHVIFLFAFIASLLLRKKDSPESYNYFFMIFICSGVILSGLSWRSKAPIPLKIYFSIFALTIPLFMFSPSMLLNFLLTMNYNSNNGPSFNIYQQYYPLTRDIYIYTRADNYGVAAGFSAFITSAPGQKIVMSSGLVPATMPVRLVQTTSKPVE